MDVVAVTFISDFCNRVVYQLHSHFVKKECNGMSVWIENQFYRQTVPL